jgi:hypothetical protein
MQKLFLTKYQFPLISDYYIDMDYANVPDDFNYFKYAHFNDYIFH